MDNTDTVQPDLAARREHLHLDQIQAVSTFAVMVASSGPGPWCHMTCHEAETTAALLAAFGYDGLANGCAPGRFRLRRPGEVRHRGPRRRRHRPGRSALRASRGHVMTAGSSYPVGTIVVRRAGGDRYEVIASPSWMREDARRTVNLGSGIEGSKSVGALDKFYTVDDGSSWAVA